MDLAQLQEFKALGYTVLRGVHDPDSMAGWRATQDHLQATTLRQNVRRARVPDSQRVLHYMLQLRGISMCVLLQCWLLSAGEACAH